MSPFVTSILIAFDTFIGKIFMVYSDNLNSDRRYMVLYMPLNHGNTYTQQKAKL